MRRTTLRHVSFTLPALALLGLAGCGGGGAKALGPVPTAPATTVPPTTSTTVGATSTSTSRPPATTAAPTTTVKPATGGTPAVPVACANVGFAPNTDDVAGSIVATGMSCVDAEALVRKVGAQVRAVGGPSQVVADGFTCVRTSENEGRGLPSSDFECTSGSKTVTFHRT